MLLPRRRDDDGLEVGGGDARSSELMSVIMADYCDGSLEAKS